MQEYINELQQKVGLTAEQAKQAIETIVTKVKSKIPESLHGSIDSIFSGQGATAAGDTSSFQQKARDFTDQAEEKLKEFGGQAKEQLSDFADKAEDLAEDVQQKAEKMTKGLEDKLSDLLGKKTPPSAEKQ